MKTEQRIKYLRDELECLKKAPMNDLSKRFVNIIDNVVDAIDELDDRVSNIGQELSEHLNQ